MDGTEEKKNKKKEPLRTAGTNAKGETKRKTRETQQRAKAGRKRTKRKQNKTHTHTHRETEKRRGMRAGLGAHNGDVNIQTTVGRRSGTARRREAPGDGKKKGGGLKKPKIGGGREKEEWIQGSRSAKLRCCTAAGGPERERNGS